MANHTKVQLKMVSRAGGNIDTITGMCMKDNGEMISKMVMEQ
jgi:hypothetical protein